MNYDFFKNLLYYTILYYTLLNKNSLYNPLNYISLIF